MSDEQTYHKCPGGCGAWLPTQREMVLASLLVKGTRNAGGRKHGQGVKS